MMTSAVSFSCGPGRFGSSPARRCGTRRNFARAAALTESHIRILDSRRNSGIPTRGLRMTSTAPASSACIIVADPSSVSEEHITTGTGCCAMSLRRNVMPSMRGISTSSVMTSGTSSWMRRAATNGSGAVPMTSISGSASRMAVIVWRTEAESSTIRTRRPAASS